MAEMYPQTLLDSELKSKAEGRVFDALRDGLDDSLEGLSLRRLGYTRPRRGRE